MFSIIHISNHFTNVMPKEQYNTRKQKLLQYLRKHKELPTYEEMLILFKLKSKGSLHKYVTKFIEEGIIRRNHSGRLIATSKLYGLRQLGSVQAGFPSAAEEEILDTMSLDEWLIDNPESSYILTVSGDSMIDAGIVEGDMVIVDRIKKPKTGSIVVAQVDGDWTMKYFIQRGERIFLRPANKRYPDIYPQEELKIGGVVSSVIRKY